MAATSKSFDISQLPSLKDGMTVEQETITRRKTCRFIMEAAKQLKFQSIAISTAMVFFHRFYAKHSFKTHDRFEVAVAAILLAGKTEETPRKLNNVIDECYKLKVRGMQQGRISTQGGASVPTSPTLDKNSEEFAKLKERVLLMERVILHTIGFELSVNHPYMFIADQVAKLVYGKKVEFKNPPASSAGAMNKMKNEVTQYAMSFANDSMQTLVCLQFPPQNVAAAMIYMAAQFSKVQPTGGKDWTEILEYGNVESLASICLQVIELIMERKGAYKETFEKIKSDVIKLRERKEEEAGRATKRQRT